MRTASRSGTPSNARPRAKSRSGAIYKTLGRLEDKGYLSSRLGDPTPERGGRRKKLYRLEALGSRALKQSVSDLRRLTRGLGRTLEAL
jgi:DNA-binding PadR family transcriptional regulator